MWGWAREGYRSGVWAPKDIFSADEASPASEGRGSGFECSGIRYSATTPRNEINQQNLKTFILYDMQVLNGMPAM